MRLSGHLAVAWLASAFAFSLSFVVFMFVTAQLEGAHPTLRGYFRVGFLAFGAGLLVQLVFGGFLYIVLSRIGLFRWWAVVLAYVVPVALFGWYVSDTTQDLLGTIPWLLFALIVALVTWFFASVRWPGPI